MKDTQAVLVAVSLGALFVTALAAPMVMSGHLGVANGQQAAGPFFGGMMTTQGQVISVGQAVKMMGNVPQYVDVIQGNNTIVFGGTNASQSIRLVVLATDLGGAANLTRSSPPNYATDDVFVIYGLVNPTIVVPHDARLEITVVNLDEGMYHNFAITTSNPPYSYMAMQGMMYGQGGLWTIAPFLPPANGNGIAHEYSYTVTVPGVASLWYICTYPGHAQNGMYGKMLVIQ